MLGQQKSFWFGEIECSALGISHFTLSENRMVCRILSYSLRDIGYINHIFLMSQYYLKLQCTMSPKYRSEPYKP